MQWEWKAEEGTRMYKIPLAFTSHKQNLHVSFMIAIGHKIILDKSSASLCLAGPLRKLVTSRTWSPTMTQQSLSVLCLATSSALTDMLTRFEEGKSDCQSAVKKLWAKMLSAKYPALSALSKLHQNCTHLTTTLPTDFFHTPSHAIVRE